MKNKSETDVGNAEQNQSAKPLEAEIRAHAELLWIAKGRPEGQSEEIWLEAERALTSENKELMSAAKPNDEKEPTENDSRSGSASNKKETSRARATEATKKGEPLSASAAGGRSPRQENL
jgi:hypothetical protein